jgi:hypothetical protein
MSKPVTKTINEAINANDGINKVYSEVYRNCRIGMANIKAIKPQVSDHALLDLFNAQYKGYETLSKEIELQAAIEDKQLDSPGLLSKAVVWGEAFVNAIKGNSPSDIAEYMLQGINSGMLRLTKLQNAEKEYADNEMIARLMGQYRHNEEVLKAYL